MRRKEARKERIEGSGKKNGQFGSFLVDHAAAKNTVQVFLKIHDILPS